jgi:hypothetical protein
MEPKYSSETLVSVPRGATSRKTDLDTIREPHFMYSQKSAIGSYAESGDFSPLLPYSPRFIAVLSSQVRQGVRSDFIF